MNEVREEYVKKILTGNRARYAVITMLVGTSYLLLYMHNYAQGILNTLPEQSGINTQVVMVLGFSLPFLLVFLGGIIADTYGSKKVWALAICAYGIGGLGLQSFEYVPVSATFPFAMIMILLFSIFTAWKSFSIVWLYDQEGTEGIKMAHGLLLLLLSVPFIFRVIIHKIDISWSPHSLLNVLQFVVIMLMGVYILTFPEQHRDGNISLIEMGKEGLFQFTSNRVLQLLGIYLVITGFSFSNTFLFFNLLMTFEDLLLEFNFNTYYAITYIPAFLMAGLVLLFCRTNYTNLIIYPRLFMTALYFIMPSFPSIQVFSIFHSVLTVLSAISMVAIIMLITDVIEKNMAIVLSLLIICISIPLFLTFHWTSLFHEWGWEMLCVVNGVLAVVSLGILLHVVEIKDRYISGADQHKLSITVIHHYSLMRTFHENLCKFRSL